VYSLHFVPSGAASLSTGTLSYDCMTHGHTVECTAPESPGAVRIVQSFLAVSVYPGTRGLVC